MAYQFSNAEGTMVQNLGSPDKEFFLWDVPNSRPVDIRTDIGRKWVAAGSPTPIAYSP